MSPALTRASSLKRPKRDEHSKCPGLYQAVKQRELNLATLIDPGLYPNWVIIPVEPSSIRIPSSAAKSQDLYLEGRECVNVPLVEQVSRMGFLASIESAVKVSGSKGVIGKDYVRIICS